MTTNGDILMLAQLFSPSFPVGAFAYSHGLERAVHDGYVTDAATLEDWLDCLLADGSARADAVLLNAAYGAAESDLCDVDDHARAFAASKERIQETDLQGAAFCETVAEVWGIALPRLTYPVAIGRTARLLKLDPELTTAFALQAFVANLCGAAMRLVPLGQTDGQRVQKALKSSALRTAAETHGATLDDLYSNTFMSDIAAMRHETQYSRIFRT